MITSKNRITRRTILRGAGHVAIGLPFLEAMLRSGETHAQAATAPTRFVVFYTEGGTLLYRSAQTDRLRIYVMSRRPIRRAFTWARWRN